MPRAKAADVKSNRADQITAACQELHAQTADTINIKATATKYGIPYNNLSSTSINTLVNYHFSRGII